MKNKIFLIMVMLFGTISNIIPQHTFRNGVFLHHSTGGRIWGQEGSITSIPQQMTAYNTLNGYTGTDGISMAEVWFPGSSIGNEWYDWHNIFDGNDANNNIYDYMANNKIIVIKSCFPSSQMTGYGSPADTTGAGVIHKTIYNYKWHWRSIVKIMEQHPENFFVIWTNAPLEINSTNSSEALLANQFCTWAKDTLATGNDFLYGSFPPNVYVFDFFHKLADEDGIMLTQYRAQSGDSHPNAAATDLIAPQFVQEIFDAAITYETIIPVELTSFTASTMLVGVELNWSTATELNNNGFVVERCMIHEVSGENWIMIGFVKGQGTSTYRNDYSFIHKNADPGKYLYRLKQIDFDGNYEYSKVVEVDFNFINYYSLQQNYPNPFNPATTIRFILPHAGNVKLGIYNILGEEIISLVNEYKESGVHTINFDANGLNSGVYLYKIETNGFVQSHKMMLIK